MKNAHHPRKNLSKVWLLTLIIILCLPFTAFSASQLQLEDCDYDEITEGSGSIEIEGDTYSLYFESLISNSMSREGSATDPFVKMFQQAQEGSAESVYGEEIDHSTGKRAMALLLSFGDPVCATSYRARIFYLGDFMEKDDYYAVRVCRPESSDCMNLKIPKKSALGSTIRLNGVKKYYEEERYAWVQYSGDIALSINPTNER